jgi:beta-phosphoglucomutase family hydrolase
MIEAVIFDMDGVIIDSEPIHKVINDKIYKELSIEVTDEEYMSFIGVTGVRMWSYLKEKHGLKPTVEELIQLQYERNIENLKTSKEKPIPGVVEFLTSLKTAGIPAAVASSSKLEVVEMVMKLFNIRDYFKLVVGGNNVKKGKPDPEIFLLAADKLGVSPKNCIVVEDSANGVRAAKAAGMKCVGFRNVNSGNQDISPADLIVDDLRKLDVEVIRKTMKL